jgi:hypothetical protein
MTGIDMGMNRRDFMKTAAMAAGAIGLGAVGIIGQTGCSSSDSSSGGSLVLARVEVPEYLEDLDLPVYADLEDDDEVYYALVIASESELIEAGVSYRVLDDYVPGVRYLIAWEEEDADHEAAAKIVRVLYDDGEHIIVRYKPELSEILPEMGFILKIMSSTPINFTTEEIAAMTMAATELKKDAQVEAMIKAVSEENVKSLIQALSGEKEVEVEGSSYLFTTRHTSSGEPVRKATQYVYDRLRDMGLNPDFQDWQSKFEGYPLKNRNVVGEITGQEKPEEIIVLIAHLDSISEDETELAPGADDNASGCVALLAAADIMRGYRFRRTVRFVFTTGEEQALFGSEHYAEQAAAAKPKQNIVAVINLDMIAYCKKKGNSAGTFQQQVKTRNKKNRGGYTIDAVIANTYLDVVKAYELDTVIEAILEDDGELESDHSPFWDKKYAAIWVIEYAEKGFLNPEMHTKDDKVHKDDEVYLNLSYFVATVKASLGTAAHLAAAIN